MRAMRRGDSVVGKGRKRRKPVEGHDPNDSTPQEIHSGRPPSEVLPTDMHHNKSGYNEEDINPGATQCPCNVRNRIPRLVLGDFKQSMVDNYQPGGDGPQCLKEMELHVRPHEKTIPAFRCMGDIDPGA